jgi:hypothetical protein
MKRIAIMASAAALVFATALPVIAQEADSQPAADNGKVLGTVVNGNRTTVFEAAGTKTVDMNSLKTWSDFAASHPDVARSLGAKPSRISDEAYLAKHPDLAAFFTAHPDIRDAMIANPGNFVVPTQASNQ